MSPPLLLVPGMLTDERVWRHVVPLLPSDWQIRIANVLTQDNIKDMALDAWKVLQDLDQEQAVIVAGFSLGGYVIMEMLSQPLRRIHAIALLSTSILPESAESRVNREKTIAAMQANFPKVVEGILKYNTHEASDKILEELREMQLTIGCEVAVRQMKAAIGRNDHRVKLANLTLPTALMCGEYDRVTPPDLTRQIQECMPHASLTLAPTGHMLPVQQPEVVAQCLQSLWDSTLTS